MDRFLPVGDGLELAKLARKKLPNLAIILMTDGAAPAPELRAHLDGYLPKPFRNLQALVDEIQKALQARRPRANGT